MQHQASPAVACPSCQTLGVMADVVIRAAPLRKRAFVIAFVVLLIGGLAIAMELWFKQWFHEYLSVASQTELVARIRSVFTALAVFVTAVAAWEFWFALRILRAGQWPLPGAFVLRDTPVRFGARARVRGVLVFVAAVFSAGVACYAALFPILVLKL